MRQRGFTLLEMMLILLLMGVSAGMVMLAFPASRDDSAAQTWRALRRSCALSSSEVYKPVSFWRLGASR